MPSIVDSISQGIAQFEGYYTSGSVADRNNNPGNLRIPGTPTDSSGFTIFASPSDGWRALANQVNLNINRGLNLNEFFGGKAGVYSGYAPAADKNNPDKYAAFVAAKAGIPVDQPLANFAASDMPAVEPDLSAVADAGSSSGFPWMLVAVGAACVAAFYFIDSEA